MKKYLTVICCAVFLSVAGFVAVRAAYYTGPRNSLYVETRTGWLWSEGTLSNDSEQHHKKLYVQVGNEGSRSTLVDPSVHSVTHKDSKGLFEKDFAMINPCWKDKPIDPLVCKFENFN